ncbi:amino acid permease [Mycoplasmopsis bovirhinis]|uniref:APC family permease n=1 Tax=Mycoplasmopsis bovirhinis TaxID=29553 RepID=UPI000C05958A|nr:APC family permease [Mycoplasmopsis bovirhinis]ATO31008.1 amino acid permease [Mycoplasmopsis bovirhinis]
MTKSKKNSLSEVNFILYGLNYVVGFGFIATISSLINQGVWGILIFILTSIIIVAVIFAFSRAGQKYQNEIGGSYLYAKKTFGKQMTFFQGWNQASQIILFAGTTPLFFARLISQFDQNNEILYTVISVIIYISFVLLGTFGYKLSKNFIFVTAVFKWITLALGFGLIIYLISQSNSYAASIKDLGPFSLSAFAGGILSFIYAYGGFESLATISKDIETKRFKKIMIYMFLIVFVAYFIFYFIFLGLEKSNVSGFGLDIAYKTVWGTTGVTIFAIGLFFNRVSSTMGGVQPKARMIAALAKDGFFPIPWAQTNKHNEYRNAIIVYAIVGTLSSVFFSIIPTLAGVNNTFEKILAAGNISYLIQYLLTIFTVWLWSIRKEEKIPVWEKIIYVIGMVAIIFTLIGSQISFLIENKITFENFLPLISYVATIIFGYLVWFISAKYNKKRAKKLKLSQ